MRSIFLFSIFVIIYGSLFPFDFQYVNWANEGRRMLFSTSFFGGKITDILSNILLFIPLGFSGSELISRHTKSEKFYIYLCFFAFILAIGLQILQIYIPQRFPAFYDAVWNIIGTFVGILLANFMARRYPHILNSDNKISLFILLSSWIFFLLLPFIFSFEKSLLTQNINAHISLEEYKLANIFIFTGIWLAFERLLDEMVYIKKNILFSLESVLILTTVLKIFTFNNVIEPEIFLGGIIAVIISKSSFYKNRAAYKCIALILIPSMFYYSLYPFEFTNNPYKDFIWIPFAELFSSNILGTLRTLFFKIFVYGAIVWTVYKSFPNAKSTAFLLIIYASSIEFLQHQTLLRIGGLTEILLVILLCGFLPRKTEKFDLYSRENNANR